jgi:hypothetical protein
MEEVLQKFECYAWEITRMRSGSDAGTSSPVSPVSPPQYLRSGASAPVSPSDISVDSKSFIINRLISNS